MEPKAQELPPWAKYGLGVGLSALLAFIAAKYGVTPQPMPTLPMTPQSQAQPLVIVIGSGGQPAYAGANACQCPAVAEKK